MIKIFLSKSEKLFLLTNHAHLHNSIVPMAALFELPFATQKILFRF